MHTTMEQTVSETEGHAMRRLLAKARTEGIRLGRDDRGHYWASSTSRPGHWYEVTGFSCTCPGFQGHQRCKHLAALHAHLGWITDETPLDPEPVAIPEMKLVHTPAGWFEDDINHTDRLRWKPARTSIVLNGIEVLRVSGEDGPTVVATPGTEQARECTDRHAGRSHYDEVVFWIRAIAPEADLGQLLGNAELFPVDEFLDETFHLAA